MVGLLTFKGECSTKKETPDIRSPEVGISAFLYSKLITLSFCQLYCRSLYCRSLLDTSTCTLEISQSHLPMSKSDF